MIFSLDFSLLLLSFCHAFTTQVNAGPIDTIVPEQDARYLQNVPLPQIQLTLVIRTMDLPFNVVVSDHTGVDASHRLTVRHYSPAALSSPGKRSPETSGISPRGPIFRLVNTCPAGWELVYSRCLPVITNRVYTALCTQPGTAHTKSSMGSCVEHELCVDNWHLNMGSPRAWCFSIVDTALAVVNAKQGKKTASIGAGEADLPPGSAAAGFVAEAIMTGTDPSQTVLASTLEIEAQRSITVHGQQLWQTLPGGTNQCVSCSNLELANVPAGTQRFNVNVQLQDPTGVGVMHLVAFSPSLIT